MISQRFITTGAFCLITTLLCGVLPGVPNDYAPELNAHLIQTPPYSATPPASSLEKMYLDVFGYATLPYSQPIQRLEEQNFPLLTKLVEQLCTQYGVEKPALFLASDTTTPHIDIKICTYNTSSALLLHPGTFTALTTKVFERYLEQVIVRLQLTSAHYTHLIEGKRKSKIAFGVCSLIAPLIAGVMAKQFPDHAVASATLGALIASLYGGLALSQICKKYAGITFQRVSSFHNDEQAREDYFPALKADKTQEFVSNPDDMYGIEMTIKIQKYLQARNEEFRQLEQDSRNQFLKKEGPLHVQGDSSWY